MGKLSKEFDKFEYECPRCHNGNVIAQTYGAYDQFERGKCTTCEYEYDDLTENMI
jgi:transposase-like protein